MNSNLIVLGLAVVLAKGFVDRFSEIEKQVVKAASDGAAVTASGDVEDMDSIRHFSVTYLRREQDIDLLAFGVKFDNYYLETSLYIDGKVEAAVEARRPGERGVVQRRQGSVGRQREHRPGATAVAR